MKGNIIWCVIVCSIVFPFSLGAFDITVHPPKVSGTPEDGAVNAELETLVESIEAEFVSELEDADIQAVSLVKGFATANAFASHAGSIRSVLDYGFMQVSLGASFGFQNPTSVPFNIGSLYEAAEETFDVLAGGGIQLGAQVGINLSFLLPGLHGAIRLGKFAVSVPLAESVSLDHDLTMVGLVFSYPILKGVETAGTGWSGVSIGAGAIYESLSSVYSRDFRYYYEPSSFSGDYVTIESLEARPSVHLEMESSQVVVPLEVITGVKAVFMHVYGGLGMDLAFGSSELRLSADPNFEVKGYIDATGEDLSSFVASEGSVEVKGSVTTAPVTLNPKLIMGTGWFLGPVVLETSLLLYFNEGSGFSGGITIATMF
ncbi:Lsa36 family surface (lipo)protein [Spirochaeta thermophila]|uniref:Uncharacterized protein n=1 Tax=Winmispira thermophila (strain ATCC 49972 / DSM 6192 / RI 19.B1) TaxID=665571 RepID=E0RQ65_WINT6|nr:hypothetical protein [Spirochaeta thermophila]ADN01449.1 hypothetical protein STHERM_c04780 [Spirochaeta thermophila DSM 6192]